jgi:hypothetical protein
MFFGSCPNCQEIKENNWDSITFFHNSKLIPLPSLLIGTTLFHLTQKFQKIINVFDDIRAYMNSQKTHFKTLVL